MVPAGMQTARRELLRKRHGIFNRYRTEVRTDELLRAPHVADWVDQASDDENAVPAGQLAEVERLEIEAIDRALRRMEEGRWGKCAECGGEIGARRLEAMLDSTLCVGYADSRP